MNPAGCKRYTAGVAQPRPEIEACAAGRPAPGGRCAHKDPDAYTAVRDRRYSRRLRDGTGIRIGDRWDERIQDGMDRTAVAVLILS